MNKIPNLLIGAGTGLMALTIASNCIYKVNPGERAIVFNKFGNGISPIARKEGFHFMIPVVQEIIKYDIKIQPFDYYSFCPTKTCKKSRLKSRSSSGNLISPFEQFIPKIHIDLNKDYANKVLPAIGNEVLKTVMAQYDAEHLLKNREKISKEIKDVLVV